MNVSGLLLKIKDFHSYDISPSKFWEKFLGNSIKYLLCAVASLWSLGNFEVVVFLLESSEDNKNKQKQILSTQNLFYK